MKSYLFLILTFSTFMVVACGDDDPEGVGQSRNVSSYDLKPGIDSKPLPGLPETECVTLPGISVVGFYLVGGGGFGAMYAVNYPSQPYLVSSVQGFTSGTGCSNTAKTDRIAYVQSDFQTLRNHAQALISAGALANPGGYLWATNFLNSLNPGGFYYHTWPDGSVGTYYLSQAGTQILGEEASCPGQGI